MKKVWKQVFTAMLAMLLLACACGAYAENDPQKLLAGLADYLTNDEWWGQKEFCTEWKMRFGLTGEFELIEQNSDEETKFCDLAYQLWVEKCGITNENDYSLASVGYLVRVTEGDASRDYWLVSRDHDEMMNFYVLYDRASEEALATTSVEEYLAAMETAREKYEANRALQAQAITAAKAEVLRRYSNVSGLTEAYLDACNIAAYENQGWEFGNPDINIWVVEFMPKDNDDYAAEYRVVLDEGVKTVYKAERDVQHYPNYTQAEYDHAIDVLDALDDVYMTYEEKYQGYKAIPVAQKAELYQLIAKKLDAENLWDFASLSYLAQSGILSECPRMPAADEMSEDEAIALVKETLMKTYALEQAETDALRYYATFAAHQTPGIPLWQISVCVGRRTLFEATINAQTYTLENIYESYEQINENAKRQAWLQEQLGDWGTWSIEEKARYGGLYHDNGEESPYGVPGEDDISYERALVIAKEALMKAYPDTFTEDEFDSARICPYFTVKPYFLYDKTYEMPIYYLSFEMGGDPEKCYEIILDGHTGEVYLTHNPQESGNG